MSPHWPLRLWLLCLFTPLMGCGSDKSTAPVPPGEILPDTVSTRSGASKAIEQDFNVSSTNPGEVAWLQEGAFQPPLWVHREYTPPVQGGDAIIIPTEDGLRAIRVADGSEKWRVTLRRMILSSPVVSKKGITYVGDSAGSFYAISPTGSLLWTNDDFVHHDWCINNRLTLDDERVYVGTCFNYGAIQAASGQSLWKVQPELYHGVQGMMVTALGALLVEYGSDWLILDGPTGEYLGSPGPLGWTVMSPDEHLISLWGDSLMKLDIGGNRLWHQSLEFSACGEPVVSQDGSIFLVTSAGDLYKLAAEDGHVLGHVNFEPGFWSYDCPTLSLGSDGSIYAAYSEDGWWDDGGASPRLYAFGPDLTERWRHSWPEWMQISSMGQPMLADGRLLFIAKQRGLISVFAMNANAPGGMMSGAWAHRYRDSENSSRSSTLQQVDRYRQSVVKGTVVSQHRGAFPTDIPIWGLKVLAIRVSDGARIGETTSDGDGGYALYWISDASLAEDVHVVVEGMEAQGAEEVIHFDAGEAGIAIKRRDLRVPVTILDFKLAASRGGEILTGVDMYADSTSGFLTHLYEIQPGVYMHREIYRQAMPAPWVMDLRISVYDFFTEIGHCERALTLAAGEVNVVDYTCEVGAP